MTDLMMQLPGSVTDGRGVFHARAMARERDDRTWAAPSVSESVSALQEIVEALDRRIPRVERAGEARIAADAERLRAAAIHRLAVLRNAISGWENEGGAGKPR